MQGRITGVHWRWDRIIPHEKFILEKGMQGFGFDCKWARYLQFWFDVCGLSAWRQESDVLERQTEELPYEVKPNTSCQKQSTNTDSCALTCRFQRTAPTSQQNLWPRSRGRQRHHDPVPPASYRGPCPLSPSSASPGGWHRPRAG